MSSSYNHTFNDILTMSGMTDADRKSLQSYHEMLTSDIKNSIQTYRKFEDTEVPRWKLYRSLQNVMTYADLIHSRYLDRGLTFVDRRCPVVLAVDDFVVKRYGRSAFATDHFYSNAHGGVTWGNLLVDVTLKNGSLAFPISYEIHEKQGELTAWERGQRQVADLLPALLAVIGSSKRIWVAADCTYANQSFQQFLGDVKVFYLLGIPKDRCGELFGRTGRVDEFIETRPLRHITVAGRRYHYKHTVMNVRGWGRRQILAIDRGQDDWKYFVSNNLQATIPTLIRRMRDRWPVEDTHRSVKQFHGGEHFYVWSEASVRGHFCLAYLSGGLAYLERFSRRRAGQSCTMESLYYETLQKRRFRIFQRQLAKQGGIH